MDRCLINKNLLCDLCGKNPKSLIMVPCFHLSLCNLCKLKDGRCPICNSPVKKQVQIYVS